MSRILLLGDAHLRNGDQEVEAFLRFLDSLPSDTSALYLLGDLFDLWIGAPPFLAPIHRRVAESLDKLRRKGIRLAYVEGNRDYHLRKLFLGHPFDELEEEGMDVGFGPRRIFLAHGDLVNRADRPYRLWRRLAKGPSLLGLFRMLPSGGAIRAAEWLEGRIARTNARHRIEFPEEECRRYSLDLRERGYDTLVLGHFHQELVREYESEPGRVEVFVLPAWRDGRRYLGIASDGTAAFESFPG
jgi:UDP-2,3-diacylglucosamine hydrolase